MYLIKNLFLDSIEILYIVISFYHTSLGNHLRMMDIINTFPTAKGIAGLAKKMRTIFEPIQGWTRNAFKKEEIQEEIRLGNFLYLHHIISSHPFPIEKEKKELAEKKKECEGIEEITYFFIIYSNPPIPYHTIQITSHPIN